MKLAERKLKLFEVALDTRKFEIDLFWRRSTFFWGFIGAAFVAYAAFKEVDGLKSPRFVIANFGLVCAVSWYLINLGSKYWQEAWEKRVSRLEQAYFQTKLFSEFEAVEKRGIFWNASDFSVSRITIGLSQFTCLVWCGLAYAASPAGPFWKWDYVSSFSLVIALGYIIVMALGCHSKRADHVKRDIDPPAPRN